MGSVDTKYLNEATGDRKKRNAVGTYQNSGLSQYTIKGGANASLTYSEGVHFPLNWVRFQLTSNCYFWLKI